MNRSVNLDQTGLLKSDVCAILIDGLERLSTGLHANVLAELGNPDPLCVKVRRNFTLHRLGDVTANAAFFLGQTRTVDFTSNTNFGTADAAYSCHRSKNRWTGEIGEFQDGSSRFRKFPEVFHPDYLNG